MKITTKVLWGQRQGKFMEAIKQRIVSQVTTEQKELFTRAKTIGPAIIEKDLNAHLEHHHLNVVAKGRGRYLMEYYIDDPLFLWLMYGTPKHEESASGWAGPKKYTAAKPMEQAREMDVPKSYKTMAPRALSVMANDGVVGWFSMHLTHFGAKPQQWFTRDLYHAIEDLRNEL